MDRLVKAAVIVPAYQAASTLADCLVSLANQQLPLWLELEIIVVDDGSSDGTAEIAQHYRAKGVRLVRTCQHGAAAARNTGVREASPECEIILFTDADCIPTLDWAACLVRTLREAAPDIAGIKGAYATRQRAMSARFSQLEFEERYARFRDRQVQPDFADTYSAAYRREVLAEWSFDESLPGAIVEDAELGWRLRQFGYSFKFEPAALVYHRHTEKVSRYFIRKFRIAFWRVALYQRYPGYLPADTHTSQAAKSQMLLLAAAQLGFILGVASRFASKRKCRRLFDWGSLAALAGLQVSFKPFLKRAAREGGTSLVLGSWLMLNLRVAAYTFGASLGLAVLIWRKAFRQFPR